MTDKQKVEKLRQSLKDIKEIWMNLPCGYEDDPMEENPSPVDSIAYDAGIAIRRINEILKETE